MYEIHTDRGVYLVKEGRLCLMDGFGNILTNRPFRWVIPPFDVKTGRRRTYAEYRFPSVRGTTSLEAIRFIRWL